MMWRAIIILAAHMTVAMFIWGGYSWLFEGIGLNPLIAFPAAVLVYVWTWIWIVCEAREAEQKLENYLESLERFKHLY